jgi:hypothetical protein
MSLDLSKYRRKKQLTMSLKTATKEDLGKQRLIKIQEKETTMSLKTATDRGGFLPLFKERSNRGYMF